jgi:hypothetical protein
MDRGIQQHLQWVKRYEQSGDAGFVCRRMSVFLDQLYANDEPLDRYQLNIVEGLHSHSRRP